MENQRVIQHGKKEKKEYFQNLPGFAAIGLASILGLGVSNFLLGHQSKKEKLEDHPMCGITTGGKVSSNAIQNSIKTIKNVGRGPPI